MSPTNSNLNQTDVVAYLDAGITLGRNLMYCATFQIVWNQLVDEIIKSPITLDGDPPSAKSLNKRLFEKEEIAEECYLAMAGFGRDDITEKIKRGLKEKFGRETRLDIKTGSPNDILSYAYLEKNLPFDTAFDVFDKPLSFNDGIQVQSFGIWKGDAAADQVVVLDYDNPDDFIIKLQASPKIDKALVQGTLIQRQRITDEIILAKVKPASTLLETLDSVFSRIGEEKFQKALKGPRNAENILKMHLFSPRLDSNVPEILQIPKIDFDVERHYTELEGKHLLNQGFENYWIAQAIQAVKFKLDETGAILSSEGFMDLHFGIAEEPRRFIFDKPFLFCLREKDVRYPYLALWINNSDLLVKA
jgi:hypothetical protein